MEHIGPLLPSFPSFTAVVVNVINRTLYYSIISAYAQTLDCGRSSINDAFKSVLLHCDYHVSYTPNSVVWCRDMSYSVNNIP